MCLETKDARDLLLQLNETQEAIILEKGKVITNYEKKVDELNKYIKGDSVIKSGHTIIINKLTDSNKSLEKNIKKANFNIVLLKAVVILELVFILALSL